MNKNKENIDVSSRLFKPLLEIEKTVVKISSQEISITKTSENKVLAN